MYHCFGCSEAGDVYKFMMKIEGLSFIESVKELAGPAGITIEERELSQDDRRRIQQRATAFDLLEAATTFFESTLWTSSDGATARAYLEKRDIHTDTCRGFRLGWAPAGWTNLIDHLHHKGFSAKMAVDSGVARESQKGRGPYDAFRERLIIPITDDRGRVIAFGGRLLEGDGPKYINSPETAFYEKSKVLYGMQQARPGIQKRDRALVVEGYFDVISLHQAGFPESVATCGTALTKDHMKRLRNLTRNVVVLLDADEAGSRAAERSLPLFVEAGVQPHRLQLQDGKDPDELIRESGPAAMEKAMGQTEPMIEWVLHRKLDQFGYDSMGKERALDELVPLLASLPTAAISRVAAIMALPETVVRDRVRSYRPPREPSFSDAPPKYEEGALPPSPLDDLPPIPHANWRPDVDIVHLIWLLVHRYDQVADLVTRADPQLLHRHPPTQGPVARLLQGEPVAAILTDVEHPRMRRTLSAVVARQELYAETEAARAMCAILERLHAPSRKRALAHLTELAERAQRENEWPRWREVARLRAELVGLKKSISRSLSSNDPHEFLAQMARSVAAVSRADQI